MTTLSEGVRQLRNERRNAILRMRRKVGRNTLENSRLLRKIARYENELRRLDRMERSMKIGLVAVPSGNVILTHREIEVMDLLRYDLSNKEIGVQLNFSERTAKFHISNLLLKYGCVRRGGLIAIARDVAA